MMSHRNLIVVTCIVAFLAACRAEAGEVEAGRCMPEAGDYALMWWANGWHGEKAVEPQILCVQTGRWGMALDVRNLKLAHFGKIDQAGVYAEAVGGDERALMALGEEKLEMSVTVGGRRYRAVRAAANQKDRPNYPVRFIDSGRFVQRFDILQVEFEDEEKRPLAATARLEVMAWPDRVEFVLEMTPSEEMGETEMRFAVGGREMSARPGNVGKGQTQRMVMVAAFGADNDRRDSATVQVQKDDKLVEVEFDPGLGCHRVKLAAQRWSVEQQPDRLEKVNLTLTNPSPQTRPVRLMFDCESGTGITGLSAMLRDEAGNPTGIPVQLSKNWHTMQGRTFLYQGPWFHGYSMVRVPANSSVRLQFNRAWARWGGLPAASHAQLCLIGWGTNQFWDEAAIGSWGESICYDPDGTQCRSMIDDIRPLMVWGMTPQKQSKWTWTNNVGGGDFLVYYDGENRKQILKRVRTAYLAHGPNLTKVVYAGVSADDAIAARMTVSAPRCDDVNRAYHWFRYDVLKPTNFSRLAFYQVGSDGYNDHQFEKLARGNLSGLVEEWSFKKGGKRYDRAGLACEGEVPWFSLHEGTPRNLRGGAWANRGLVVRSWKARLGGKDVPTPFAACYGTENGPASMNVELAPPPGLSRLEAGDFVEAEVELVIMPMSADDYYGPNEALRASLKEGANTWKPIHRQAAGNDLRVKAVRGELLERYPVVVRVDANQGAEVEIKGGIGYVPVTFVGVSDSRGPELLVGKGGELRAVNQAVHGNDYWQADYEAREGRWNVTYNVDMDGGVERLVFKGRVAGK